MAQEKKFANNLKDSSNIAIVADKRKGLDALCASIGLKELTNSFLEKEDNFTTSIYFLDNPPHGSEILSKKVKVYRKIGEKTLSISFPSKGIGKVQYEYDKKDSKFILNLVGFVGGIKDKSKVNFEEKSEQFDMVVGVGFESKKDFVNEVEYIKPFNKFLFNKKNLEGNSLTEGIVDVFFKEKVKPSNLASLAFFTAFSYQK